MCDIYITLSVLPSGGNFWGTELQKRGPIEINLEMELLRQLDQFLDRVLCFATEGYEQYSQL